jgi:hypothetical protein
MRSEARVREKFHALVDQRDECTKGSAAYKILDERIVALAWVINHPKVRELLLTDDVFALLDCVS